MKADNLFKFVAIRAPVKQEKIIRLRGDDRIATDVDKLIGDKMERDDLLPEQARLAAGSELVKDSRYFLAAVWGQALTASAEQVRTFLQQMVQEPNWESFLDGALELLAPVNRANQSLDMFLTSENYHNFKQSLWLSFYATVLNPYERLQDREIVTTWLLFLYPLEADAVETFETRLQHLRRTRPAVPCAFFVAAPGYEEPQKPKERPEDPSKKRWKEIQNRIAELQEARRALSDLFTAKLQRFEQIQPVEEPVKPVEPEKDRAPIAASTGSRVDLVHGAPWRITVEDLKAYAEPLSAARTVGILPETATLPEVINRLDTEIASLTAESDTLGEREELMLVGKSFVHVRRAHAFRFDMEDRQ